MTLGRLNSDHADRRRDAPNTAGPGCQRRIFEPRSWGIELCRNLGDAADQAAWLAGISMTSMPF
jgi:hypothetical protein